MKHRPPPPESSLSQVDYAPKERRSEAARRHDRILILMDALGLIAFGIFAYFLASLALRQATVAEALCQTDMECFERYCAQDLSCDGGPEPAP